MQIIDYINRPLASFTDIKKRSIRGKTASTCIYTKYYGAYDNKTLTGLEIRGCLEPRAPLNSLAAPSNLFREPKDVLVSIHPTLR